MSKYDHRKIAEELRAIADNVAYFGNALHVAKDIPIIRHASEPRAAIIRYLSGREKATDHLELYEAARLLELADPLSWLREFIETHGEKAVQSGYLKLATEPMTPDQRATYIVAKLGLICSEAGEAMEAVRHETRRDDHCPEFSNFQIELADIVIRTFNLSYDVYGDGSLADAIIAKLHANQERSLEKEGKKI